MWMFAKPVWCDCARQTKPRTTRHFGSSNVRRNFNARPSNLQADTLTTEPHGPCRKVCPLILSAARGWGLAWVVVLRAGGANRPPPSNLPGMFATRTRACSCMCFAPYPPGKQTFTASTLLLSLSSSLLQAWEY